MMEASIGSVGLHNHQSPAFTNYRGLAPAAPQVKGCRTDVVSTRSGILDQGPRMEERDFSESQIDGIEGRSFRARPCIDGTALQLGVVSTRGNLMEVVTVPIESIPALIALLVSTHEEAGKIFDVKAREARIEQRERDRKALAANPHLNGTRPFGNDKYIVRPR